MHINQHLKENSTYNKFNLQYLLTKNKLKDVD
jgi:hypothetical protein